MIRSNIAFIPRWYKILGITHNERKMRLKRFYEAKKRITVIVEQFICFLLLKILFLSNFVFQSASFLLTWSKPANHCRWVFGCILANGVQKFPSSWGNSLSIFRESILWFQMEESIGRYFLYFIASARTRLFFVIYHCVKEVERCTESGYFFRYFLGMLIGTS